MSTAPPLEPTSQKPLRLWPGVVIVAVQWLLRFVLPIFVPETKAIGVIGGLVCGLLVVVWWLCFSRAAWPERLGALALMVLAMFATSRIIDVSIAKGMMGLAFPVYAIPVLCLAFVVWAVATRRLAARVRRITMTATILLACGVWMLMRTGGVTGGFASDLHWRWTKTPEERLLAQAAEEDSAGGMDFNTAPTHLATDYRIKLPAVEHRYAPAVSAAEVAAIPAEGLDRPQISWRASEMHKPPPSRFKLQRRDSDFNRR